MLPTPTPVPGSAGRFLDGTFAHMANHSSKAEVFFKGSWQQLDAGLSPQGSVAVWPGEANLLLASERQTYQLLSCSLLRVTPPPHPLSPYSCTSVSNLSMYSSQGSNGLLMGQQGP